MPDHNQSSSSSTTSALAAGSVAQGSDAVSLAAGEHKYEFSIQSVSKPFTAALAMERLGAKAVREKVGVEPTGLPFNSKLAIELYDSRSANPLVNAGAIATVSLLDASSEEERWKLVHTNINDFAGRELSVLEEVYRSEYENVWGNRGIANVLYNYGRLYSDPEEALNWNPVDIGG